MNLRASCFGFSKNDADGPSRGREALLNDSEVDSKFGFAKFNFLWAKSVSPERAQKKGVDSPGVRLELVTGS